MAKTEMKKKGLRIVIIGCGKVGANLLVTLRNEGHNITIVDTDAKKINDLAGAYDVMGICGNGATHNVQEDAGVPEADLVIAVTGTDELNLLCCTIAKQTGKCATIARVCSPDYVREIGYLRDSLGLAMIINPENETAKEISHLLMLPTALEINTFAHGQVELIKVRVPEENMLCNRTLAAIRKMVGLDVLVSVVERGGEVIIPGGMFEIKAGDVISLVGHRKIVKKFLHDTGFKTNSVKDCMIVGGGKAAYYLASQLSAMNIAVKIIEKDRGRCEELAESLLNVSIINDDGSKEEVLVEEGLQYADSFVPLTGLDEENVLLSLYARQVSKSKVITKINRDAYRGVIDTLDLDTVIYPKNITSEAILAYVRARQNSADLSNIETLSHMFDGRVEAIEFLIDSKSAATDKTFLELSLKSGVLVAVIFRNGKVIIPGGADCIKVGDFVTVVTTHTGFTDITDILAEKE